MGSGTWSAQTYKKRAQARGNKDAFAYNQQMATAKEKKAHPTLDPFGLTVRESRDNDEHPESNSIMVGLDVSGSMAKVVRQIHGDLPQLLELLLEKQYVPDPQIAFVAFGNGSCDPAPLQVGQFESDNRMDQHLENMILGGGCDPMLESAELVLLVAARHTEIDCYEKRGKKGYLFIITDEMAYDHVKSNEVKKILGYDPQAEIPLTQIVEEAGKKYNLFVIIPTGASRGGDVRVSNFWRETFGQQNVIMLNNPDDVSEVIALTIGLSEGTIGMDDGIEHLREVGSSKSADSIKEALSVLNK